MKKLKAKRKEISSFRCPGPGPWHSAVHLTHYTDASCISLPELHTLHNVDVMTP
jgi:hypothetical protein